MKIKQKLLFSFSTAEVTAAFGAARKAFSGHGLKILQAPAQSEYGRVLIVTPRACGKAHDRNKIRRRIKSIFYENNLYLKKSIWIVLVRKDACLLDFDTLQGLLLKVLV